MWIMWAVVVIAAAAVIITALIITGSVISNICSNKSYEHIENQKFNNGYLKELKNRVECLDIRIKKLEHDFYE